MLHIVAVPYVGWRSVFHLDNLCMHHILVAHEGICEECVHAQYISLCRAIAYGTLLCNRVSRNRYNERGHCCQRMYVIILYKFRRGIKQLLRSMLTPFDRVEVDTLLHEFPQRAQLAEEGNALLDSLQDVVDL